MPVNAGKIIVVNKPKIEVVPDTPSEPATGSIFDLPPNTIIIKKKPDPLKIQNL